MCICLAQCNASSNNMQSLNCKYALVCTIVFGVYLCYSPLGEHTINHVRIWLILIASQNKLLSGKVSIYEKNTGLVDMVDIIINYL